MERWVRKGCALFHPNQKPRKRCAFFHMHSLRFAASHNHQ
ncbi:hypothetical protein DAD186_10100 [Dermabacter vaginalis]|uniref:Uncharacterized protein n=1 Tax=Dermabacter vaginalis TaxID=1630135 RepID=A0A1B0ZI14_9MICO|nr:hypothetical protein DAD186_10100 [Dermabacter vaginalis]